MSDDVLAEYLSVSQRQVWRLSATGVLPKPVKLTAGCVRWIKTRVDAQLSGMAGELAAGEG